MENIKYIILDFGKVLARPTTGNWFITPKFLEIVDMKQIDIDLFNKNVSKYDYLLSKKIDTEEEEYKMFSLFYRNMLNDINYIGDIDNISNILGYDMAYGSTKYTMYDDVIEELDSLSKKCVLLLLSDNWPCAYRILKEYNIDKYFNKVYISSIYGYQKKDKKFFDFPIKDYKIKQNEAIFIDDNPKLLDIARSKGLDTRLMVRDYNDIESSHEIIHNLKELNIVNYNIRH